MGALPKTNAHVVDVLGNVIGRDQPIMRMEKAVELVTNLESSGFLDENTVFFDPFCKAGELLLACAYATCLKKMNDNKKLMDVDEIYNEVFNSKRYYGIAPDERHHKLSLRTFLGNENSHNKFHNKIIRNGNYLSEVDGRLNKEKFEREFEEMIEYIKKDSGNKNIVVVGNPPYQEADGGAQASAKPVYNLFTEKLLDSEDIKEFILVIPARWFAAGKGVDKFRERITKSTNVKRIFYFQSAEEVFPTVHIQGGVCFLNIDKNYEGDTLFQSSGVEKKINLSRYDIIPDDPYAYSIIEKVLESSNDFLSDVAWARKPFGLATNHFKNNEKASGERDGYKCYIKNRNVVYVKKEDVKKRNEFIDKWKVSIPCAYGLTGRCTLPEHQFFLVEPGAVMTETYSVIDTFDKKEHAENFQSYLQTKVVRYLLGLRKITQHIPRDRWQWVPTISASEKWSDKKLQSKFGLTNEEMLHIEKKVKEWS